jgi:hypothetical protein
MKKYEKPALEVIKVQAQEPFAAKTWYGTEQVPFTKADVSLFGPPSTGGA